MQSAEQYTHGYGQGMTSFLAGRTAASNAAFFLPHLSPGMSLLDCGCGPGAITVGLAQAVAPGLMVGVDLEASQLEQARRLANQQGVRNISFHTASVYHLPYPDKRFDAVFGHAILEHLGNPLRALTQMRRVLKSGGILGVREIDAGGHLLFPELPLLIESLTLQEQAWRLSGGNPYIGRSLRHLLHQAGFVRAQASSSYDHYGTLDSAQQWAMRMADNLSDSSFAQRVIPQGWADQETLEQMRAAWQEWAGHPDAFYARARVEAIGWVE